MKRGGVGAPGHGPGRLAAIFAAIGSAYFLSEFFRISHAVIGPELMREIGFGVGGLGLLTSVFFFAFAAQQLPNGFLFDRFGPRRTVPCLMLVGIAGALIFAAAPSLLVLSLARVLMGIGWAVAFMGGLIILARWIPTDRYAMAVAAMIFVGTLGNLAATGPWAAFVAWLGWRAATAVMAAAACASALLVVAVVRDAPPDHAYHGRAPESLPAMVRGLGDIVRIRAWRYLFAMNFLSYAVVINVLALLGPVYLTDIHGLDLTARGEILLLMTLAMAAGTLCVGPLDRLLDTRKEIVSWGAIGIVAVYAVLALAPGLALWQAAALFALIGFIGASGVVNLAHARAVLPDRLVGRGMVSMALAAFAGSAVLQLAAGLLVAAFPQVDGAAPEIAYRCAFGFVGLALLGGVVYHRRIDDAKPSADRPPRPPPSSEDRT